MHRYSTPLTRKPRTGNLTDDVVRNAADHADRPLFSRRTTDGWDDVTAGEFHDQVRAVARGLVAAGISPGDRVALLSRTRYEWTLLDYAIWFAGAVTVPVYETSSADQVGWILGDSGARAVVVETAAHVDRVAEVRDQLPGLAHVWAFDDGAVEALTASGSDVPAEDLEQRRAALSADSLATIIYTSGTTGRERGCVLTHGNLMAEIDVATGELAELFAHDDAATLLFLPLAHVFARVLEVTAVHTRTRLGYTADVTHLMDDMRTFRPTFLLAVPRIFEKIFNTASQNAAVSGRGPAFERAAATAIAYSKALDTGRPGIALRTRHRLYDRLVYASLREALGGECRYAISGAASLGERLGHFLRGIGLTVLEGYGLTETTAAVTVNLPDACKIGTVGRPLPGVTVLVADDGELLVQGGQVFGGYWHDDAATGEVLDADGWLHTGDLGEIDDEGFVTITGRKKEVLVTAGGKNVAPEPLEDRVRAHFLVGQCMVVGDGRPYVAALVTLDRDALELWASQQGKSGGVRRLVGDPDVEAEVAKAVNDANKSVSQAEGIRKFKILSTEWSEDGGQLTPSLKLKRTQVLRECRDEIERLYER